MYERAKAVKQLNYAADSLIEFSGVERKARTVILSISHIIEFGEEAYLPQFISATDDLIMEARRKQRK